VSPPFPLPLPWAYGLGNGGFAEDVRAGDASPP
jgi:hypothetical protein